MALLDRAAKRVLEQLHLIVRPQATAIGQGAHRSKSKAVGLEFADHRLYAPGDDIRKIDWKAFARNRQLLVKTFEEERDIYIYLLLDVSPSMMRGAPPKLDVAKSLAAAFTYLGMKAFDRVRILPFGSGLGSEHAPARHRIGFPRIEGELEELEPEGVTNFAETTKIFAGRYPRHGLVVVLSDLMEASDWNESFRSLASMGHELWVVRVACKEDERPDFRGELELHDAERGETVHIRVSKSLLESYRREVRAHIDRCHEACRAAGGRFVEADVERPVEELLESVLAGGTRTA